MAERGDKPPYEVGYGKPPRETRFRPGRSGNPKGRPKRAKNFATAFEQELLSTVPIVENGRRRLVSKREVVVKQLVNKAVAGDLKATSTLLDEVRAREAAWPGLSEEMFGGLEQQPVVGSIVERILAAAGRPSTVPSPDARTQPDQPLQLELPLDSNGNQTDGSK